MSEELEEPWSLADLYPRSGVPYALIPWEKDAIALCMELKRRWSDIRYDPFGGTFFHQVTYRLGLSNDSSERDIDESFEREIFCIARLQIIVVEYYGLTQFTDVFRDAQRIVVNAMRLAKQVLRTATLINDVSCPTEEGNRSSDLEPPAKKKRVTAEQREWLQENWHLFEGEAHILKQVTQSVAEMKSLSSTTRPSSLCVVCLSKERSFCYVPCGHKCVCAACALHPSCATSCPICKTAGEPMRVFDA